MAVNMDAVVKVKILEYFKTKLTDLYKTMFASQDEATTGVKGLMSAADKAKLDGIEAGATNYQHPNVHPATMITEDGNHRFITDTERTNWNDAKSKASAHETALANMTQAKINEICAKYSVGSSTSIE